MYANAQIPFMDGSTFEVNIESIDQLKLECEIMLTYQFVAIISFCLTALALSGCATTTAGGAVDANRSHMLANAQRKARARAIIT
jgi:hypothetical protein